MRRHPLLYVGLGMGKRLNALAARVRILRRTLQPKEATEEAFNTLFAGSDPWVLERLQAIAPCLSAQQLAADDGCFSHSCSGLVHRDIHILGSAATHNFVNSFDRLTPSAARFAQRGKHLQWAPPPVNAIQCAVLEASLCRTFQWNPDANPFTPFCGAGHHLTPPYGPSAVAVEPVLVQLAAHIELQYSDFNFTSQGSDVASHGGLFPTQAADVYRCVGFAVHIAPIVSDILNLLAVCRENVETILTNTASPAPVSGTPPLVFDTTLDDSDSDCDSSWDDERDALYRIRGAAAAAAAILCNPLFACVERI